MSLISYLKKEDSSSPMVAVESLFMTSTMDALDRWGTATDDIPGAFLYGCKCPCEARVQAC